MLVVILVLALLAIAVAAGFLGSLTGLGGGVVIIPVLVVFFGVPFGYAVGASMVSVLATSTTSGAAYVKDRLTDLRIGNFLQVAAVPGALIGATATVVLAHTGLAAVLLIALGLVLIATAPGNLAAPPGSTSATQRGDSLSQRLRLRGSYYDRAQKVEVSYEGQNSTRALEVMLGAGVVAGLFGIGGGVLNVLALDRSLGLPMKVSTATSNFMIGATATAGAGVLFAAGLVIPVLAAPVAIGTTMGAYLGSRLLPRLTNRIVRWVFVLILLALAVEVLVRGVLTL